jgi:hypothetical protein
MNVSTTESAFHAEKNAMLAAMMGGSKIAPRTAARREPPQVHASRRNAAPIQLPATASTMAGPVNTNSSVYE